MAYDELLAERVRERLADVPGVTDRRMFGGLAFLVEGHMTVCVAGDDLMVRVGRDDSERALTEPGAGPMEMKGRPMAGWVLVDGAHLDDEALDGWIARAGRFVAELPPK